MIFITLITKEYKTVSSMLLMLRWRTSNEDLSRTLIIFTTWPGVRRDIIFKTTLDPEIFASTSATGELQHAPSSLTTRSWLWSINPKLNLGLWSSWGGSSSSGCLGLGLGLGLRLFLLRLLDSKDCKTWCNSLMNSITPPMIDAWSP